MLIPIDEVVVFDICTHHPSTGAVTDADSTPSYDVFEESTDTPILDDQSFTKRTSLTGNYRGSFTASVANGFEAGKWYSVIASATVNSVTAKAVAMSFRVAPAESSAGVPKVDPSHWGGVPVASANVLIDGAITAAKIAADAITDAKVASDVTIASVTGAVGSVSGAVGSVASGGITAASFAADAITAAKIAADVTTELQSGLATASAVSALDTKLGTPAGASVSADIAAIEAQTDDIGVAGAGLTALASAANLATLDGKVDTIDNFLDTEIAAILSDTNAIKVVTDLLTAANAEPTGVPAANATPLVKLAWLFMALRNRLDVTSTKKTFYDDGGAAEWEKDVSDDGTTYSESEANAI
jgi:hypothetical protein